MTSETVRSDPRRLASFEPAEALSHRPDGHRAAGPLTPPGNRFARMLDLSPAELERAMRREIEAEHDLPDPIRYPAALGRLRAWLELDADDARVISRAYESAMATFPPVYAARRRETESAVMFNGMRYAEFRALTAGMPWPAGDAAPDVIAEALTDGGADGPVAQGARPGLR